MSKKSISKMLFSKEKVELASVQELSALLKKYYSNTDTANSIIKGLVSEARRAEAKIDEAVKSAMLMDKAAAKVQQSVKELGINPSMVEELKSAELAINEASKYQRVLSTIKKFISSI
jgi:hypothetical protein